MRAELPESLDFLFKPSRYKVAYGGRGGAKSWGFARALLIQAWESPLRILCAREFQSSIQDSVHLLLSDQIKALEMGMTYEIQKASIKNRMNGSVFGFEGLRHNVEGIKSYEGVDRVWVEEAKNVSKASWDILTPTVRKDNSEIWITFNPELETDETYKRFVLSPPKNAVVRKINWTENPWFPEVLKIEKDALKEKDPDAYLNIWEGHCRVTLEGAIYAKELRQATEQGRITRVPYDETAPVHTFWDLGWSDCTSIWFAQKVGFDYRIIDFYQNRLHKLPHYLKVLQDRGYVYGTDFMPHDADNEMLAAKSIKKQMEAANRKVVVLPRIRDLQLGINATRSIFSRCYFDEVKCADGMQSLRHYRYGVDEHGQWSRNPEHDEYSHGADAFRTLGESIGANTQKVEQPILEITAYESEAQKVAWLST